MERRRLRAYSTQATRIQRGFGENPVSSASSALCRTPQSHQGRVCNPNPALPKNYCQKGHVLSARWPKKLKPSCPRRCGVLDLGPQPQQAGLGYPPDLLLELSIILKFWPNCLQQLQNTSSSENQRNYCYFKRSPTSRRCI